MNTLNAALKDRMEKVAGKKKEATAQHLTKSSRTVLVGAHYPNEVRRALLLVQARPENDGRNLKELLGEAINDLCAKYGQPQPYTGEEQP